MVAPEAVEGDITGFEFFVPGFEACRVFVFRERGADVFGFD